MLKQMSLPNIFFNSKQMVQNIICQIVKEEELEWDADHSKLNAHCPHQYCPSSIQTDSMNISGEEHYYLSYIPHFHNNSIYQGNPEYLPSYLQRVLFYYSGIEYFYQQAVHFSTSSSSSNLVQIVEKQLALFVTHCNELLQQSSSKDFGHVLDNSILEYSIIFHGKYIRL